MKGDDESEIYRANFGVYTSNIVRGLWLFSVSLSSLTYKGRPEFAAGRRASFIDLFPEGPVARPACRLLNLPGNGGFRMLEPMLKA